MNLLKIKQVAELLNTTERTVWNKIHKGDLKAYKIAGLIRVDGDRLTEMLRYSDLELDSTISHLERDGAAYE